MPKHSGMADLIVKGAIALVTAAFFVGAYLQFQMPIVSAMIASLALYTVLMMIHVLTRRTEREKDLVGELSRLEEEVARLKSSPARSEAPKPTARVRTPAAPAFAPTAPPAPLSTGQAQLRKGPDAKQVGPLTARALREPPPFAAPATSESNESLEHDLDLSALRPGRKATDEPHRSEPSLSLSIPGMPVKDAAAPPPVMPAAQAPDLPPASPVPARAEKTAAMPVSAPMVGSLHDYWPGRVAKPTLADAPTQAPVPAAVAEPVAPVERETDLDAVQGMIKRLADEVGVDNEPTLEGFPPPRQESALRASLNALQTAANVMRSNKKKSGGSAAGAGKGSMPPPIMPQHARLAALAEAVAAGRIDVSLAPIVGLSDQEVQHYEVVASPRDQRGTKLTTSTRDPQLALAGLLPMLDGARLRQAADVARSMEEEGREASLLTAATAVSLANDSYLDALADVYRDREGVAGDLVLMFAQADVRTFGGSEWSALTDMRDLGFRFGVEDVTDFDYEFNALCAAGFTFVKLDAATLLGGLAAPNGSMPAAEVCRNLSELGLTLIVTGIDDEEIRDMLVAAGAPLGQGSLFGDPLPVGGDSFVAADDAAA